MESNEKSKTTFADVKGHNDNNVKREVVVAASSVSGGGSTKVKAAAVSSTSTVKDAKSSVHKERNKCGKSTASSSSPSSTSRSTFSAASSKVKEEVQPASCSLTSSSTSSSADQNFTAADSISNPPSKSFVACKVCGDKASGYHYGVTSCEGCKGFFRRSIQKQIEYRCLRDGKCHVIRLNRNRCQFCRFKKCLAVGMSRDSVRYGRVPKRPKERNDESKVTQSEPDQSAKDLENKQLVLYELIVTISQAHQSSCSYTEERTARLLRKPAVFSLSDIEVSEDTVDSLEQQKLIMWEHFADYVAPSVQRIVEFAKKVPGFSELIQDDQLILIKSGFFEIWLVHISRMIDPIENTLTFCDGSYVSRQQLELVFDQDFVTSLFSFGVTLNNLCLSDTELGIFSAMVLLSAERHGLNDTKFIQQQQDKLTEALKLQISRSHTGDTHLFSNVLMKLPELRTLGTRHNEHLQWFRIHWQRIKLPPLFAEIFDIPKSEEKL